MERKKTQEKRQPLIYYTSAMTLDDGVKKYQIFNVKEAMNQLLQLTEKVAWPIADHKR